MTRLGIVTAALMALAGTGWAADAPRLADMKAQLAQLSTDLQSLRAELVASGPAGMKQAGGVTALDRMNTMEAEIARLTGQVEALSNRVDKVVADGSNRIGDLEFRLCELEEGCDVGALMETPPLGQPGAGQSPDAMSPAAVAPAAKPKYPAGAALQQGEQAQIDRAREVLGQGDFRKAADLFAAFAQTYPAGPLTGEARYYQGEALAAAGDRRAAAEAWLEAFAGAPGGPMAARSLLALGESLGQLGRPQEACATLTEVVTRFGDTIGDQAAATMTKLSCADLAAADGE